MTVVIALTTPESVLLVSDTAVQTSYLKADGHPKWVRRHGCVWGWCGDSACQVWVGRYAEARAEGESWPDYIQRSGFGWVDWMRERRVCDTEGRLDAALLVATPGGLFFIQSDGCAVAKDRWAIGSGAETGLGALTALVDVAQTPPRKALTSALDVACRLAVGCRGRTDVQIVERESADCQPVRVP